MVKRPEERQKGEGWPDGYPGCAWLVLILLALVIAEVLWIALTVWFSILMASH